MSFLAEFPPQIGGEPVEGAIQFGRIGKPNLSSFVVLEVRGFVGQVDEMALLVFD